MDSSSSRLTVKYQATIPAPVREALGLSSGDSVVFEVREPGVVVLRKQQPMDLDYLRAVSSTLESEWLSDEDEAAYAHL
ncbi:AbrB/MazE/SpoVT family DNA-binding domain-containing protein [Panacagrimonas sp.]|uniref:AbrB/MazE/SpoVT family DNA-binding domain-containing protein n=1 Tax=Panacagrimonas sp. TaxID=2480088 RepID=UPI003B51D868